MRLLLNLLVFGIVWSLCIFGVECLVKHHYISTVYIIMLSGVASWVVATAVADAVVPHE